MKTRTCPHCNYRYSILEYSRIFKTTWNCKNCGSKITVDNNRRLIIVLLTVLPASFGVVAAEGLQKTGLSAFVSWAIVLVFLIVWIFMASGLEKFKRLS